MNPKLRLNPAHAASLALTASLMLLSSETKAIALGEPAVVSEVGRPLHVELPLLGGDLSNAGECLRLVSEKGSDGLPWVKNGRLSIATRGKTTHLVITHPDAVFEPVLRLAIEDTCDAHLRRDYTLLLSFPTAEAVHEPLGVAAVSEQSRSEPPLAKPAHRQTARDSAGAASEGRPPRRSTARQTASPAQETPQASEHDKPPPGRDQDRLVLGGGVGEPGGGELRLSRQLDSLSRLGKITDQERDELRREQAVVMEIDRTIVAQLELNDRIRRLEEIQANMAALERKAESLPAVPAPAAPPLAEKTVARASSWIVPTAGFIALSTALAAGLLWLRRRNSTPASGVETEDEAAIEPYIAPLPKRTAAAAHEAPELPSQFTAPDIDLNEEMPRPAERAPLGWETVASAPESAEPLAPVQPIETFDETAEEHESAIELAEIMMGFGRIQGAAETLAEFIASNPKRAVTPWLKLLEVYRAADLRQEFDALAQQLNKTFNVKAVTWDTFEEAKQSRHSMEQMGHISSKVQRIWGTEECQAYLEKLLRDNRDGKREGFPLSVIDEILMLASVLEDQLGPYRPESTDVQNSDQWDADGHSAQDAA
ncbi:FimV family protein [Azoarcus sp. KH32C]|uniref:type IV pilus assembly protein FimV n=1 Tax=Azoarcus sp. KH32C TaxID=748247 RepID=UPI00023865A7|nr:hypothetical protein [Azoarcus sp. KH32C]BAL23108.1 hypothetical protein AZKH_0769 [Azoarcus sp. KH32C]